MILCKSTTTFLPYFAWASLRGPTTLSTTDDGRKIQTAEPLNDLQKFEETFHFKIYF